MSVTVILIVLCLLLFQFDAETGTVKSTVRSLISYKLSKLGFNINWHSRIKYRVSLAILLVESNFSFQASVDDLCIAKLERIISVNLHFSFSFLEVDVCLDIGLLGVIEDA